MKAFNRTAIALCLSMAILFLTIRSAAAADIEIRGPIGPVGPVYDASGIMPDITMDASQSAFYDIEDDVTT